MIGERGNVKYGIWDGPIKEVATCDGGRAIVRKIFTRLIFLIFLLELGKFEDWLV